MEEQKNKKACFSSDTTLWRTPLKTFKEYNAKYNFQTDVCALPENTMCEHYYSPKEDGLKQNWIGSCWMNPPYGEPEQPCKKNCKKKKCQKRGYHIEEYVSGIGDWVKKAYESSLFGATVVCLLPSRTDTRWWHNFVIKATEIIFIKGRLKFGNAKNSAPFPSAIVIFKPPTETKDCKEMM